LDELRRAALFHEAAGAGEAVAGDIRDRGVERRQRAAVGIAESGMLTHEQRFAAVPDLLNFLDDDALDSDTRGWVYGALRLITGEPLGNNPQTWQQWWSHHDSTKKSRSPKGILFA